MEHVKPRNPKRRTRGTSVWYGKEKEALGESSLLLSTNFFTRLHKRGKGCINSQDKLAQPDVKA